MVIDYDKKGKPYYKRAFTTQACEQLNSWLGGFELIFKRMKSGNFNWFLHTMLFYHTRHVLEKAIWKKNKAEGQNNNDDDDEKDDVDAGGEVDEMDVEILLNKYCCSSIWTCI